MKANAPEKIYLYPSDLAGIDYDEEWLEFPCGDNNIEYTRTDIFIEKACDLLVDCIEDFMARRMEIWDEECKKQTLENLRKALKGQ